ncbi:MAG: hypothetical protein LC749_15110 [Actinobacteria bacterium]|nr:hypothetical protein [Actinomycetota bacterium]
MKLAVLEFLVEESGFVDQKRDPSAASEIARTATGVSDAEMRLIQLRRALAADALCGHAWQGILQTIADAHEDIMAAVHPLLILALEAKDPNVWAQALIVTLDAQEVDLAEQVVGTATSEGGLAFIDAVRRQSSGFSTDLRMDTIDFVNRWALPSTAGSRGFTLRMVDDSGELTEFHVNRPSGD